MAKSIALTIKVEKLENVRHAGDWHDKVLKWGVFGPFEELQYFSTKAGALAYRRVRRDSDNQVHALRTFARLP